ncbi:hypothetical protein BJ546DRAFT_949636 [Cryomyces antarcticus]
MASHIIGKDEPPVYTDSGAGEKGYEDTHIDLNSNLSAKIKNPLAGVPRGKLLADVEEFARTHELEEITGLLQKGALVAQDPAEFETVEGLTDQERESLRNEVIHKWRQPRSLYMTVILCSVGAAVQYVPPRL